MKCPNNCGGILKAIMGCYTVGQVCTACEANAAQRYLKQQPITAQEWQEIKALEVKLRKLGMLS